MCHSLHNLTNSSSIHITEHTHQILMGVLGDVNAHILN